MKFRIAAASSPIGACPHLSAHPADHDFHQYFTGHGSDCYLLCSTCLRDLHAQQPPEWIPLDAAAIARIYDESCLDGISGMPQITERPGPLLSPLREVALPGGAVTTIAPLPNGCWLLFRNETASLHAFDPIRGEEQFITSAALPEETDEAWLDHQLTPRLLTDPTGRFAALVHDYGRYGILLDLHDGRLVARLDGGDYYPETVPFSACFVLHEERAVLIHRTAWNRLDATDAASGRLLSERASTAWQNDMERPAHYLDYFHGGLHPSPGGSRVLDDGWVWQPFGVTTVFDPHAWLTGNPWETEDHLDSLQQVDDWNTGIVWLDEDRVVVERWLSNRADTTSAGGLACLFDFAARQWAILVGPRGQLFSDGERLFSATADGLSVWSLEHAGRIGHIAGFIPIAQHTERRELTQLSEGRLICWSY